MEPFRRKTEADPVADLAAIAGRRDNTKHATTHLDVDDLLPADRLDDVDLAGRLTLAWRNDRDVLRPHTHGRACRVPARSLRGRKRELDVLRARDEVAVAGREVGRNEVHRRGTDEAGDEAIHRVRVELVRGRVSLKPAVAHDGDAIGHA